MASASKVARYRYFSLNNHWILNLKLLINSKAVPILLLCFRLQSHLAGIYVFSLQVLFYETILIFNVLNWGEVYL